MSSDESYQYRVLIVVNSLLAFITTVSCYIRLRRPGSSSKALYLQNVMILLAALCGVIMSILQCTATQFGLGLRTKAIDISRMYTFLRIYPAIMVFYFACNMFVKFALLMFYLETTYQRRYLYTIWFMIVVAFGFGISSILVVLFQCTPLDKLWNQSKSGQCVNIISFLYANACIMITNDVVMYIMPIAFTWNLPLQRSQRVILNILFALGLLVVATSILRLLAIIRFDRADGDMSYHIDNILLWSAIENHVAIFIACTPSIKALTVRTIIPMFTSGSAKDKETSTKSHGNVRDPWNTTADSEYTAHYTASQVANTGKGRLESTSSEASMVTPHTFESRDRYERQGPPSSSYELSPVFPVYVPREQSDS